MRASSSRIVSLFALTLAACGGTPTQSSPDLGPACTPNKADCVNDTLARVCPSDGSGWLAVQCNNGQKCVNGACTGNTTAACAANMKECVSATLARVCPADGSGWIGVPCNPGQKCTKGDCLDDPNAPCNIGDGFCSMDGKTAFQCQTGAGFKPVTCPMGTMCGGTGQCTGTCTVGLSICEDSQTIATCTDGSQVNVAKCEAGQVCVTVSTSPLNVAACKTGTCTPDPDCTDFCGNKVDASADQTKFVSECVETPEGFQWIAFQCTAPQVCDPMAGGGCGFTNKFNGACVTNCTPGAQRCTAGGTGFQTCDATGNWPASATMCNPIAQSLGLVCMTSPVDTSKVVCGDPLCAGGFAGTCDVNGKFRACGSDGLVAPAAMAAPCGMGLCVATAMQTPVGGLAPGSCVVQCQPNDTRCVGMGSSTFETCVAGVWSAPMACAMGTCFDFMTVNMRPTTVCGQCAPGSHRCTDAMGKGGAIGPDIETCDMTGNWGTQVACTTGSCQVPTGATDSACIAECVPGEVVCIGVAATGIGQNAGTTASGMCTAQGRLPTAPTCPGPAGSGCCTGNTVCRTSISGHALGCMDCVGPGNGSGNESGLVDTRCTDSKGKQPGNTNVETCATGNVWPALPAAGSACGMGLKCYAPNAGSQVCGDCLGDTCTDSNLGGCTFWGFNPPVACGTTSDCCGGFCKLDPSSASPAYCAP